MKAEAVQDRDTGWTANFAVGRVNRTADVLLRAEEFGVAVTTKCRSRISVETSAVLTQAFRHLPYTVQANVTTASFQILSIFLIHQPSTIRNYTVFDIDIAGNFSIYVPHNKRTRCIWP